MGDHLAGGQETDRGRYGVGHLVEVAGMGRPSEALRAALHWETGYRAVLQVQAPIPEVPHPRSAPPA